MRSIIFTLSVLSVLATSALGGPEPAVIQDAGQWTADVKFEPLRQMVKWGVNEINLSIDQL